TPISEIPQSVSVVGREEIEDRGVTNKVDEVLRYTSGVMAQPFGADGDTDWIYIRGFDATQTGLFLDGLNLWSYGFGGFQMDPFFLERVEVLKGPASVLYGGANPGGIVNMISKRPLDENRTYTETGINNHGTAFFNFDVNRVFEEQGVSTRLLGKIDGGNTETGDEFRGVVNPQITWSPDEATKLNVYAYYSYLDQQTGSNGFLPYVGTVVDAGFGRISPDADYGEPSTDFSYIKQTMVGYEFEHEFDSGWAVSQNARYGHVNRRENSPYPYGYQDPSLPSWESSATPQTADYQLHRIGFDHDTSVDSFAIDNHLSGQFDTAGLNHDLLLGLDYKHYRLDTLQYYPTVSPISANNPVYGTGAVYGSPGANQTLRLQQVGLYAQDQIRFGDGWIATLNGRYDFVKTDLDDRAFSSSYESSDRAASGRAGLAYEFANGFTPYASVGTFFNPVIGITLGDPLLPEEGYQIEGGFKYEPTQFPGMITASVFHINKENWTVNLPGTFTSVQVGEVSSTGVELEAKADITDTWKAIASFSYQQMEILNHADATLIGNEPYMSPEAQASLWLDYTVPTGTFEGLSVGGGLRYQGETWADMANTLKVSDVLLADAAIRYEKNDWGVSLNVNNIFDKEYVSGCQGVLGCGYGESRTITLKLSKIW
ncbi:TonB-dependent siderophore receptor, partial [Rhizobium sp. PDO1-076]|uniref:TonB-dependent siderophore receptor n=2 Tax=Rhizobium TaxID=379 RepID=UPI00024E2746